MVDMGQADRTLRQNPHQQDDGVFERFRDRIRRASMTEQGYFIEKEVFEKLRHISYRLHGGSDAMRDEGFKLWLALQDHTKIELHAFGSETTWSFGHEEVTK